MNWCQHWFEYFPNPPLNILSMVENVLAHHDRELLRHLVDCGVTSQVTAAAGDQPNKTEEDWQQEKAAIIITVAVIEEASHRLGNKFSQC